jgi:hypothetical protein
VPQRKRTAGTYRHLAAVMVELGWSAVRVRDSTAEGSRSKFAGMFAMCVPPANHWVSVR